MYVETRKLIIMTVVSLCYAVCDGVYLRAAEDRRTRDHDSILVPFIAEFRARWYSSADNHSGEKEFDNALNFLTFHR